MPEKTVSLQNFPLEGYAEVPLIEGSVQYTLVKSDYGVRGSPVWMQPEDLELLYPIEIDGVSVSEAECILRFGHTEADRLEAAMLEEADKDGQW